MSTDELQRLQQAFTTTVPGAAPRADCPPAGQIWEGVRGELGPAEFRELIHHLASCPLCTEAWQLAEELESEESLEEEVPPRKPSASWHRGLWGTGTAAAAAVFLAVGFGVQDWGNRGRTLRPELHSPVLHAPVLRAPGSKKIEVLSEGRLSRDDFVLRWRGLAAAVYEDAVYYNLRVSLADDPGRILAEETEIQTSDFLVPPEALAGLPPEAVVLVSLEMFHPIEGLLDDDSFPVTVQ